MFSYAKCLKDFKNVTCYIKYASIMINSTYLKYLIANCFPVERNLSWNFGKHCVVRELSLASLRVFVNPLFICALETRCLKPACNDS
jgi:hypothetical protein